MWHQGTETRPTRCSRSQRCRTVTLVQVNVHAVVLTFLVHLCSWMNEIVHQWFTIYVGGAYLMSEVDKKSKFKYHRVFECD